jgi:hypothetical protein
MTLVAEVVFALICAVAFVIGLFSGRRIERHSWTSPAARIRREASCKIEDAKVSNPRDTIWEAACAYALKIIPGALETEDPMTVRRYMEVRNSYIAGAQGDDFGVSTVDAMRAATK